MISMEKFGDLLFDGEKNSNLYDLLLNIISKHKKYDDVWKTLCISTGTAHYVKYNNAKVLIDESYYGNDESTFLSIGRQAIVSLMNFGYSHPFINYLRDKLANHTDVFQTIFYPYVKNFSFYKEDIRFCIHYNFDFKRRNKLSKKIDRYNDIYSLGQDNEYYMPFNLLDNKYEDFCTYTWKSIFKDARSLECLKNYTDKRKYFNSLTIDRIMETFSYSDIDQMMMITNHDRWLIEKIFGVNTVLALIPTLFNYYDRTATETIILPLLNLLLECKPIMIRIALADLTCAFLLQIPTARKTSPYYDGNNNKLYDEELINELNKTLKDVIELVNINYFTMITTFYEAIQNNRLTFRYSEIDIISPHDIIFPTVPKDKEVPTILFNYIGFKYITDTLSFYPKKRTYNSNDLAWRYGCMQAEAISTNYKLYNSGKKY